jgi:hypothetical protein
MATDPAPKLSQLQPAGSEIDVTELKPNELIVWAAKITTSQRFVFGASILLATLIVFLTVSPPSADHELLE